MQVVEQWVLAGHPEGGNFPAASLSNVADSLIAASPLLVITGLVPWVKVEEVWFGLISFQVSRCFVVHLLRI